MAKTAASGAVSSKRFSDSEEQRGFFGRILLFLRQVIAELKKVTTPTPGELTSYVVIVLLFVLFMMLLVFGLDYLFGQAAFWVFGNGSMK